MEVARTQYAALLLRVGLGAVMAAHGLAKVFVFTMPGTAGFFEAVGYPGFLAYPVTVIEITGGALLLAGIWTRWAALAQVPVLLGAVPVHFANGWVFNAPNGGWEFPAVMAVFALALATLGEDGAFALSPQGAAAPLSRTARSSST